ncbi:MAG: hypothetical protein LUQ22_05875 [Methanotrichaceae archaeon]|nr:hypothetical protein [Methanotrichaceae archaeon]
MKNKIFVVSLVIAAIVFMNTGVLGADTQIQTGSTACISPSEENLRLVFRTLWVEHVVWTRLAIMSLASGSDDKDPVLNRLLKNYGDMANALKPFYGNETGDKYGDLIKEHLVIAAELVEAAKAGNTTEVTDADKRWHENANKIATFENTINPNLKLQDRKDMWNEHLNLTKTEAVAILNKDYPDSISTYDMIEQNAMMMADALTDAIVKQFPGKFAVTGTK